MTSPCSMVPSRYLSTFLHSWSAHSPWAFIEDAINEVKYAKSGLVRVASQLNSPAYFCKHFNNMASGGTSSTVGNAIVTAAMGFEEPSNPYDVNNDRTNDA